MGRDAAFGSLLGRLVSPGLGGRLLGKGCGAGFTLRDLPEAKLLDLACGAAERWCQLPCGLGLHSSSHHVQGRLEA